MAEELYTKRPIRRRFLGLKNERPRAEPGQAVVLTGRAGTLVLYPGQQTTPGEAVWGGYDTAYIVDMGQRDLDITFESPAAGGYATFRVRVSAGYRVSDPAAVVQRRLQNPLPVIERAVKDIVTQITEKFEIDDAQNARSAIREALGKKSLGKDVPFHIENAYVEVELDAKAKEFLRKRQEQKYQAELERGSLETTLAAAEAEKIRQQKELELERTRLEERLKMYRLIIDGGIPSLLTHQLAQHPDDVPQVVNLILELRERKREESLRMFQALLDADVIQEQHLRDLVAHLVHNLEQGIEETVPRLSSKSQENLPLPQEEKDTSISSHDSSTQSDEVNHAE